VAERYRIVCPHCGKEFQGELLVASSAQAPSGFKCPHCKLFVPHDRAASSEPAA
jgi:DNA-directed RNA polymerase subunit RPC12/RpoP